MGAEEVDERRVGEGGEPGEEGKAVEPRPDGVGPLWQWVAEVRDDFECVRWELDDVVEQGHHFDFQQGRNGSIASVNRDGEKGVERTGREGPDRRPEGNVPKLGDHLVVIVVEVILGKGHLLAYALEEFTLIARNPVLLVFESNTLLLVACA